MKFERQPKSCFQEAAQNGRGGRGTTPMIVPMRESSRPASEPSSEIADNRTRQYNWAGRAKRLKKARDDEKFD